MRKAAAAATGGATRASCRRLHQEEALQLEN
jgi:hypothetical protein